MQTTTYYNLTREYGDEISTNWTRFELDTQGIEKKRLSNLTGVVSALFIYCSNATEDARAMTVRLTGDEDGDKALLPDTSVGMMNGITTTTKTSSIIKIEIVMADVFPTYCWIKTFNGTADVDSIKLTWRV